MNIKMIKCDYCNKTIKGLDDIRQLEINSWEANGDGNGIGNLGDYHENCAKEVTKKTKDYIKTLKQK